MANCFVRLDATNINEISNEIFNAALLMDIGLLDKMRIPGTTFVAITSPTVDQGPIATVRNRKKFFSYCPELTDWLLKKGLSPKDVFTLTLIIMSGNNAEPFIHADPPQSYKYSEAINFPVVNCNEAYTAWYSATEVKVPVTEDLCNKVSSKEYADYYGVSHQELMLANVKTGVIPTFTNVVEIARARIDAPTYVRVDIPHAALNFSDSPRVVISIRFNKPMDMELMQ